MFKQKKEYIFNGGETYSSPITYATTIGYIVDVFDEEERMMGLLLPDFSKLYVKDIAYGVGGEPGIGYKVDSDGVLKNGFSLWTGASGSFSNQIIQLQDEKRVLYNCFTPFETNLQHLWDAYCRLKKAKSDAEIDLINELIEKDEKILDLMREVEGFKFSNYILEKERNQYKKLLNEIRDIVKNKV
jgi:predicted CopG family antitoxin